MNQKQNNFAYIDGANLHKGIRDLGWTPSDFKQNLHEKAPDADKTA